MFGLVRLESFAIMPWPLIIVCVCVILSTSASLSMRPLFHSCESGPLKQHSGLSEGSFSCAAHYYYPPFTFGHVVSCTIDNGATLQLKDLRKTGLLLYHKIIKNAEEL